MLGFRSARRSGSGFPARTRPLASGSSCAGGDRQESEPYTLQTYPHQRFPSIPDACSILRCKSGSWRVGSGTSVARVDLGTRTTVRGNVSTNRVGKNQTTGIWRGA
jgi:hypothetical protein